MVKNLKLYAELLELSEQVSEVNKIVSSGQIKPVLELSGEVPIPLIFKASVFGPGVYRGIWFTSEDIKRNMNSVFKKHDNIANNELNIDHKNNRKQESSVRDLVGEVISVEYDDVNDVLLMECKATDRIIAEKIANNTLKYVSVRINPLKTEMNEDGRLYARDFDFEELSIVRTPAFDNGKIQEVYV